MAKFTNLSQNFTMIPNWLINNQSISLKSKGLFIFLASKPNDFSFSIERIAKLNKEGENAIKTALKELEAVGLLIRKKFKGNDGLFSGIEYILTDTPNFDKKQPCSDSSPSDENPSDGKSTSGKQSNINKKDFNKKDINNILLSEIKISDERSREEYFKIAESFRQLFIKNSKKQGLTNLKDLENAKYKTWTDTVRLMVESDKTSIERLREIRMFLDTDTEQAIFWKKNIRSINKLRLKINQLVIAINTDKEQAKTIKKQSTLNL